VVEDGADMRQTLADLLRLEGHVVHVAATGREGIALARELRPDVVLCDIGLPDVDGYEVARALRGDAALRTTRLVALTGYAQPEDRRRAAEAGFDRHITKPPSDQDLMAALAPGPS
jgi:CheY-like chemotaxis protein